MLLVPSTNSSCLPFVSRRLTGRCEPCGSSCLIFSSWKVLLPAFVIVACGRGRHRDCSTHRYFWLHSHFPLRSTSPSSHFLDPKHKLQVTFYSKSFGALLTICFGLIFSFTFSFSTPIPRLPRVSPFPAKSLPIAIKLWSHTRLACLSLPSPRSRCQS